MPCTRCWADEEVELHAAVVQQHGTSGPMAPASPRLAAGRSRMASPSAPNLAGLVSERSSTALLMRDASEVFGEDSDASDGGGGGGGGGASAGPGSPRSSSRGGGLAARPLGRMAPHAGSYDSLACAATLPGSSGGCGGGEIEDSCSQSGRPAGERAGRPHGAPASAARGSGRGAGGGGKDKGVGLLGEEDEEAAILAQMTAALGGLARAAQLARSPSGAGTRGSTPRASVSAGGGGGGRGSEQLQLPRQGSAREAGPRRQQSTEGGRAPAATAPSPAERSSGCWLQRLGAKFKPATADSRATGEGGGGDRKASPSESGAAVQILVVAGEGPDTYPGEAAPQSDLRQERQEGQQSPAGTTCSQQHSAAQVPGIEPLPEPEPIHGLLPGNDSCSLPSRPLPGTPPAPAAATAQTTSAQAEAAPEVARVIGVPPPSGRAQLAVGVCPRPPSAPSARAPATRARLRGPAPCLLLDVATDGALAGAASDACTGNSCSGGVSGGGAGHKSIVGVSPPRGGSPSGPLSAADPADQQAGPLLCDGVHQQVPQPPCSPGGTQRPSRLSWSSSGARGEAAPPPAPSLFAEMLKKQMSSGRQLRSA